MERSADRGARAKAYHIIHEKLGGTKAPPPRKGRKEFKPRSAKACFDKWVAMLRKITRFLARDLLDSHTIRKSGATQAGSRRDARIFNVSLRKVPSLQYVNENETVLAICGL